MKRTTPKVKILICGMLPPPNFGHSIIYQMLMTSSFPGAFDTYFLNMKFWTYGAHKKITVEKIYKMFKYYVMFVGVLIFWRPKYVLYNSSFYPMPFMKDLLFCATAILFRTKVVFHDLGQYVAELDQSLTGFKKKALRWMLRHMGGSIIMGEKVRQDYTELAPQDKLFVVAGACEDTSTMNVEVIKQENCINVLYFSHMSRLKGVYTAFDAMTIVLKQRIDVTVTFGGPLEDAHVKDSLEKLQDDFPGRVIYAGYIEDVSERTKLFRQADIFIFPTLRDVFGLVLLHAMVEGLPIIASVEGTIPEIVPDQSHALLITKGDARALADNIFLLAQDPLRRKMMGQANRLRYEEKFTLEKYGQAMIKAFENMEMMYRG